MLEFCSESIFQLSAQFQSQWCKPNKNTRFLWLETRSFQILTISWREGTWWLSCIKHLLMVHSSQVWIPLRQMLLWEKFLISPAAKTLYFLQELMFSASFMDNLDIHERLKHKTLSEVFTASWVYQYFCECSQYSSVVSSVSAKGAKFSRGGLWACPPRNFF